MQSKTFHLNLDRINFELLIRIIVSFTCTSLITMEEHFCVTFNKWIKYNTFFLHIIGLFPSLIPSNLITLYVSLWSSLVYKSLTVATYIIFTERVYANVKKAQLNNLKVVASIRQEDRSMPVSMEVWSSNMMSAQSQFQILNVMGEKKGTVHFNRLNSKSQTTVLPRRCWWMQSHVIWIHAGLQQKFNGHTDWNIISANI